MQSRVLGWPRIVKRLVVVALDLVLALVATWIAFSLRLDAFIGQQVRSGGFMAGSYVGDSGVCSAVVFIGPFSDTPVRPPL